MSYRRSAARVAFTGAATFAVLEVAQTLLRSDHGFAAPMSHYALGRYGFFQTMAFAALGLASLALCAALSPPTRRRPELWRAGRLLLAIWSLGVLGFSAVCKRKEWHSPRRDGTPRSRSATLASRSRRHGTVGPSGEERWLADHGLARSSRAASRWTGRSPRRYRSRRKNPLHSPRSGASGTIRCRGVSYQRRATASPTSASPMNVIARPTLMDWPRTSLLLAPGCRRRQRPLAIVNMTSPIRTPTA
jgi:hypothetical protein